MEWGVAIHMGNYFGFANQILMLIPCIAIVGMVISGVVMWWRRKPEKEFGAPPALQSPPLSWPFITTAVLMMVCFPLFGASVLLILLGEALWGFVM